MAKTDRIYIRIDADLKQKASIIASKQNRTLSNFIENLLKKEIEKDENISK